MNKQELERVKSVVRNIPDFPVPGIQFKDLTTAFKDTEALQIMTRALTDLYRDKGVTRVVGIEARGFIGGAILATQLNAGFVPLRKPGKLPAEVIQKSYSKEYGTDTIEIHKDAVAPGQKVVVVDDLIATGGTVEAICKLVERLGGEVVKVCFVMELAGLNGREKLAKYDVDSAIVYEGK